jgi:hypothetical protein
MMGFVGSALGGALLDYAASRLLQALVSEAGDLARQAAFHPLRGRPDRAWRDPSRDDRPRPALRLVRSASVLSHVPGRVRFRVAGLRGDARRARAVAARLEPLAGVLNGTVNTVTGTVLVHYDAAQTDLAPLQTAVEAALHPLHRRAPRAARRPGRRRHLRLLRL